jgi:uncharacterized membrane protein
MDKKTTLAAAALAALTMAAGCAPGAKTAKTDGNAMSAPPAGKGGECYGVNTCKGTGECGGPGHSCAGQNACKGQGWITLTQTACEGRHGTYKPS